MTGDDVTVAWQAVLQPGERNAQAVLQDLARVCHVGETTHVPGDPHGSAFREGKRAVALYIFGRLGVPLHPTGG